MKRFNLLLFSLLLITILVSCNNKKLTEVVEVPLPTAQEKVSIGFPDDVKADQGSFQLEKLPYPYDALAPTVSPLTLQMHYSKHYLTYANNLNTAIAGTEFENQSIEDILSHLDLNNADIRNNAGGYYNHSLYWRSMAPNAGGAPIDTLASAIKKDFGSYENLVTTFKSEATKQFASAWVFLIVDKTGVLKVTSSQNQDNPLMKNATIPGTPILALDLWEHAYYLGYQYRRRNYIDSFFNVISWDKVNKNYEAALRRKY